MKKSLSARFVVFFVALPDALKVSIAALVVWLASTVFVQVVILVPFLQFLEPYVQPIALAFAAYLIGLIEKWVPDAYGNIAVIAIQLVLAILAAFGVGSVLAAHGFSFFAF